MLGFARWRHYIVTLGAGNASFSGASETPSRASCQGILVLSQCQKHNLRGFLDEFRGCCWIFSVPLLPLLLRWEQSSGTGRYHLHGPPSSRLKSRRDSFPGQQRALFSAGAGAAGVVSCLCCSLCYRLFPGHSSSSGRASPGSVPILRQNSFLPTQTPVPAAGKSICSLQAAGFARSRLVFRGNSSSLVPPPVLLQENIPLGKSFMEKHLSALIYIAACPLNRD